MGPVELRPFQLEGVQFLENAGRGFLGDEMGLGKTAQLIRASKGETLVVAPSMVLSGGTWADEIAKWADDPDRFTTVPYTQLAPARSSRLKPEFRRRWDTVIFDEAHYLKGRKSLRTETGQALAGFADRVFLASGTPIPNYAHELFTLLQILYPEEAGPGARFGSYWRWAGEWFDVSPTRFSKYHVGGMRGCSDRCSERPVSDPCDHYREFADANLSDRFLRRLRVDVLPELPGLTEVEVATPMGKGQLAAYRSMKKDLVAEVAGELVVSWSQSAKHVQLDRLTTGLSLLADGRGVDPADDSKLERLRSDLAAKGPSPVLVMAHYRDTVEACARVGRDLGLRTGMVHGGTPNKDRTAAVRGFQRGKLDVLVGSLETLSEGVTLIEADTVVFVEKSWKPSRNEQALYRVHRLGQTKEVTALDYVTPRSIDSGKRELLRSKTDHQLRTLTAAEIVRIA